MKVSIKKFQEGGAMPPQEAPAAPAAAPTGGAVPEQPQGENPIMLIAQMAMQALQSGDCQAALQVCEVFIQLIQQSSGEAAPEEAPQGEPVYRQGGVLSRRI